MWNNGRSGEFTSSMGQASIVKSTTITEVKAHGSTEDSPPFHFMNKIMSKFDELEKRMFGAPIVTLPHVAHTSELALAFSQPQYERPFHYYLHQHSRFVYDNQSELAFRRLKLIGPILEGLALNFLLRDHIILINMAGWF
jgi:hypothetical protein